MTIPTTTRISKKSLAIFPDVIAAKLIEIQKTKGAHSFTYEQIPANKQRYIGEGDRWYVYNPQLEEMSLNVPSEYNLCASNMRAASFIGQGFTLPVGGWAIQVSLFLGKYYVHVFNGGLPAIEGK